MADVSATKQTWLQKHERIVILVLMLVFGVYVVEKIDNRIAARDAANFAALQQAAQTAATQVQQAAQAASQAQTALQAASEAYQKETIALKATLAQEQASLAARQKVDSTLPPDALVARWNKLLPGLTLHPMIGQTPEDPSGVFVPTDSAQRTVEFMESVPVLTTEVVETKSGLNSAQDAYQACLKANAAEAEEVADLKTQNTADAAAAKSELAAEKAKARKSKWHWFEAGFVAGVVTTVVAIVH